MHIHPVDLGDCLTALTAVRDRLDEIAMDLDPADEDEDMHTARRGAQDAIDSIEEILARPALNGVTA